ncbi:hypothetical protein HDR59_03600, partial [bacterium]|nr:hypothetical protein [bacterium]
MKKVLINILCAFIPSKFLRDRLRLIFSDNQILVIDNGKERKLRLFEFKKLKISFVDEYRNNNIVKIHKNAKIEANIILGNNNKIYINKIWGKYNIYSYHNNKI